MVNDGLISALSRMENAASLPHGGPSNRRTRNARRGSFEDIDLRGANVRSWFAKARRSASMSLGATGVTKSWLSYRSFERLEVDLATSPPVCFGPVSFGSKNTIEDPSWPLARYIARSAWCIISSASEPSSGISAAPIDAPILCECPPTWISLSRLSLKRRAIARAVSRLTS